MALTTIERLRSYLGQQYVTRDDGLLSSLLESASAFFESETCRSISVAAYTDTVNGDGTRALMLRASPVVSVSAVTVNGEEIPARPTVDGEGWVLDGDMVRLVGSVFTAGIQNVSVAYTAGYAVVPEDVQFAIVQLAAMQYRQRDALGIFSRAVVGQEQTMYQTASLPISIQRVIDNYRIPRIG